MTKQNDIVWKLKIEILLSPRSGIPLAGEIEI